MRYEKMIKRAKKCEFLSNYKKVFRKWEELIIERVPENKLNNIIFCP